MKEPTDTKTKIAYSAIELFAKKGYTETSVKEIAELAGISPSSMYNHYHSKIEILDHILQLYSDYTRKNILDPEAIEEKVKSEEPKKVLMGMFYRYGPENAGLYTKILKIILHEQYRNEQVGRFFKDYFINELESYIDYIIVKLIENKTIAPVNHRYYAKILNDLCLASSMHYCHFAETDDYQQNKRILLDDVLQFTIDLLLKDDGKQAPLITWGVQKWLSSECKTPQGSSN